MEGGGGEGDQLKVGKIRLPSIHLTANCYSLSGTPYKSSSLGNIDQAEPPPSPLAAPKRFRVNYATNRTCTRKPLINMAPRQSVSDSPQLARLIMVRVDWLAARSRVAFPLRVKRERWSISKCHASERWPLIGGGVGGLIVRTSDSIVSVTETMES